MTDFVLLVLSSIAFSGGGLLMKMSDGARRPLATAGFLALFGVGALILAVGMRRSDLSVAYVVVLGLEAVATVLLAVLVLNEGLPLQRLAAIILVVAGIAWLRAS